MIQYGPAVTGAMRNSPRSSDTDLTSLSRTFARGTAFPWISTTRPSTPPCAIRAAGASKAAIQSQAEGIHLILRPHAPFGLLVMIGSMARLLLLACALLSAALAADDRLTFPGSQGPGKGKRIVLVSG